MLLLDNDATAEDVEVVAYNFSSALYPAGMQAARERSGPSARRADGVASYRVIAERHRQSLAVLSQRFPNARVVEIPHHIAHALSGIAVGQWQSCDVLVADSIGEGSTTSIGQWDETERALRIRSIAWDTDSLGYLYGAVTDHLGFRMRDEEGTVMALAAFGERDRYRDLFHRVLRLGASGAPVLSPDYVKQRVFGDNGARLTDQFIRESVPRRAPREPLCQGHRDLAAALQARTEDAFVGLARNLCGSRAVVVGGVASNCVAIGRLRREFPEIKFSVPPAPGDSGTAIGAGAAAILQLTGVLATVPSSPYLGPLPDLPTPEELNRAEGFSWIRPDGGGLAQEVAARLAEGAIVGIFRGRAEAGPRALGNRSVLAHPQIEAIEQRLALNVKKRERFRPFAPIALLEDARRYVDLTAGASPFMSVAMEARPALIEEAPVVVHRNGTARMQTVSPGANPFIEDVLKAFKRLTGLGLLINTSLNSKGHPTVGSWRDALTCLRDMDLDVLIVGDFVVQKDD